MRDHHVFGFSGWSYFKNCEGRYLEILRALPLPQTAGAERGENLHRHYEEESVEGLEGRDRYFVESALEFRKATREALGLGEPKRVEREKKYLLKLPGDRGTIWGYLDLVEFYEGGAVLHDPKFHHDGDFPRDVTRDQLRACAFALLQVHEDLRAVACYAFAPGNPDGVLHVLVRRSDLAPGLAEMARVWDRVNRAEPEYQEGVQCKYCPGVLTCPLKARSLEVAESALPEFERLEDGSILVKDMERLSRQLRAWKLLEPFGKRLEELAKELDQQGQAIPGIEFRNTGSTRSLSDMEEAWDKLDAETQKSLTLSVKQTLSLPAIEKAYAQAHEVKLKEAKAEIASLFESLIRTKPKSRAIKLKEVEDSSSRALASSNASPAISTAAASPPAE